MDFYPGECECGDQRNRHCTFVVVTKSLGLEYLYRHRTNDSTDRKEQNENEKQAGDKQRNRKGILRRQRNPARPEPLTVGIHQPVGNQGEAKNPGQDNEEVYGNASEKKHGQPDVIDLAVRHEKFREISNVAKRCVLGLARFVFVRKLLLELLQFVRRTHRLRFQYVAVPRGVRCKASANAAAQISAARYG